MKKLIFLFAIVSFFSCRENMPVVPDPPIFDTARKVLIEEFTGVRCPNCPFGSAELELLLAQFGKNLIAVSIHTSDFGSPLPGSNIDFRTSDAEDIADYLGRPTGYPSGVINRKDFDGGAYFLQASQAQWSGFIAEELAEDPKLTVNITKEYNSTSRELKVRVSGIAEEDIANELKLTIILTESNIIEPQEFSGTGGPIIEDYNHKHVFRKTMTNASGDELFSSMIKGDNYDKEYTMTVPDEWKTEDCEVIAFVSIIDGQKKEILQVESAYMED